MTNQFTEGIAAMDTGKTWVDRLHLHVARWLAKGPASPTILAGTIAFAGLGAAVLNTPPSVHSQQHSNTIVGTSNQPTSSYPANCYPDPDGDGHILCPDGWH